ncbi:MAG TPA: TadE/TadG family type IV pilus assembly protein [Bryobacteraceae bacterium]|nr:TadE/TadG family type IV pilus assembly protein [Bryobacteraceae bacterium]
MFKQLMGGLSSWLQKEPAEKRRATRRAEPSMLVYYWDGSVPEGRKIRDISGSGAYVITPERWYIGTIVRLILQGYKTTAEPEGGIVSSRSTSIPCRVVRHGIDGIGVEFMFSTSEEKKTLEEFLRTIPRPAGDGIGRLTAVDGQALVEFALILPMMFLLIVNAVNFGSFLFAWITVANGARAGAQYMAQGRATVGTPTAATAAQITTLITSDVSSLLNRASLAVRVCKNNNNVQTCSGPGAYTPPADPEPTKYVLVSVDVTYTYQPLLPLWDFGALGIHATLPPTAIHRQASMRMLQ